MFSKKLELPTKINLRIEDSLWGQLSAILDLHIMRGDHWWSIERIKCVVNWMKHRLDLLCFLSFLSLVHFYKHSYTMKVLVGVKRVVDYAVKIRIKPDRTGKPIPFLCLFVVPSLCAPPRFARVSSLILSCTCDGEQLWRLTMWKCPWTLSVRLPLRKRFAWRRKSMLKK